MSSDSDDRGTGSITTLLTRRGLGGVAAAALTTLGLAITTNARKKKKRKKKNKKPVSCTPQSEATTCAGGKCGSVADNCGKQVNCGACTGYVFDGKIGSFGSGQGQFRSPSGIAIDSDDNLYVADTGNNRIHKLANNGAYLDDWGGVALALAGPQSVAVDRAGNVYVAVTNTHRVVKLDSAGTFVTEWSTTTGEDEFFQPKGITVDPGGAVWLSDWGNWRMLQFSSAGEFLDQIGGFPDNVFYYPTEIAHNGTLYVADTGRHQILRFPGGPIGAEGTGDGEFSVPRGVALDDAGNLFVVDAGNNRVQKFDSTGAFDLEIVESQAADGNFGYLAGIGVDSVGNLFVVDEERACIHKFRPAGAARAQRASADGSGTSAAAGRRDGRGQRRKRAGKGARRARRAQ